MYWTANVSNVNSRTEPYARLYNHTSKASKAVFSSLPARNPARIESPTVFSGQLRCVVSASPYLSFRYLFGCIHGLSSVLAGGFGGLRAAGLQHSPRCDLWLQTTVWGFALTWMVSVRVSAKVAIYSYLLEVRMLRPLPWCLTRCQHAQHHLWLGNFTEAALGSADWVLRVAGCGGCIADGVSCACTQERASTPCIRFIELEHAALNSPSPGPPLQIHDLCLNGV